MSYRMFAPPAALLLPALLTLLVTTWATPSALGQSDAELRAANEALRTRNADLELELKAARARIAELEQQIADLHARLAGGGAGPAGIPAATQPAATIDESVATASPRALLRALQGEYTSSMSPVGGWSTPRERTVYFRALEKWILGVNRAHRAPVDWIVRFLEVDSVGDKKAALRVQAIDPGNGAELGDPFLVMAPSALFRRLESGGFLQPGAIFELRGAVQPDLRLNVDRETQGAFDQPRFVGPFTEFGLSVDPQSMTAVRLNLPAAPPTPPAAPTAPVTPQQPAAPKAPTQPIAPKTPAP